MVRAEPAGVLWFGVDSVLRRSVRFSSNAAPGPPGPNGYAGSPPIRGMGRLLEVSVECAGEAEGASGYLINIKSIDAAVREHVAPLVIRACRDDAPADAGGLLRASLAALERALPVAVRGVELRLSPYYSVAMDADARDSTLVRLRFDFAAAHRLHVAGWSEAENLRCFGKCNNPNGHGHNYQVEPCVEVAASAGAPLELGALERVVQGRVIERFDHKHLNLDTAEFADGSGLNPSVENIARVCYELLADAVAGIGPGVRLRSVRVWETDRTSSEYPG